MVSRSKRRGETKRKRKRERLAEAARRFHGRERQKINSTDSKIRSTPNPHLYIPPTDQLVPSPSPPWPSTILFYLTLVPRWRSLPLVLDRRVPCPSAFRDPSPILWAQSTPLRVSLHDRGPRGGGWPPLPRPSFPRDQRNSILSFRITIYNKLESWSGRILRHTGNTGSAGWRRGVSPAGRSGLIKRCTGAHAGHRAPRAIASRDLCRFEQWVFASFTTTTTTTIVTITTIIVETGHVYVHETNVEGKRGREWRKRRRSHDDRRRFSFAKMRKIETRERKRKCERRGIYMWRERERDGERDTSPRYGKQSN